MMITRGILLIILITRKTQRPLNPDSNNPKPQHRKPIKRTAQPTACSFYELESKVLKGGLYRGLYKEELKGPLREMSGVWSIAHILGVSKLSALSFYTPNYHEDGYHEQFDAKPATATSIVFSATGRSR